MPTPRKPTAPTTEAIDQFCAAFDDLFSRFEERTALREYLIGLLLPREHNKTLVELAAIVPGARRQALHHFVHDAPWDANALNCRRLAQWQAHPVLGPHAGGVLIVDETGDPKRGHRIVLAAQQYLGKLGHVANGVVAVTSHWTDGSRHVPLGVKPYRPSSRLPKGRKDPGFHTKPQLGWALIQEAQAAGIPFRLVVADAVYGESSDLEAKLFAARIPYVMGLRPSHGTWQLVEDPAHPPAFTPAEAAQRLPASAWQRTVRYDSHGKELVRYVAELELGPSYGPDKGVRLIAATRDPTQLKPESTWYLATSFPLAQVSTEQVYELYRLREWIEHFYKPVKHELGWADYQMRTEQAIVRHWQLVLLAYTFSLLVGTMPTAPPEPVASSSSASSSTDQTSTGGEKIGARRVNTSGVGRHPAPRAELALPLGTAAALLATLVDQRPTARTGRAPRPRRQLSAT
ncbi:MAG: IS701 family transposase [Ktedonobacterales bacterium]